MDKEQIISWLKDGDEHNAVKILRPCKLNLIYHDTGFALQGEGSTDIFSLQIMCPRKILERIKESKNEVNQIENAIQELSQSLSCYIENINWCALVPTPENKVQIAFSDKTIRAVADIITGDKELSPYRSGRELVSFFNEFLDQESYGVGFPSRWFYAQEKLKEAFVREEFERVVTESLNPLFFIDTKFEVEEAADYLKDFFDLDGYQLLKIGSRYQLNEKGITSVKSHLFDKRDEINIHYIEEHLQKCDEKIENKDFSGAITNARSLLENILIELEQNLEGMEVKYDGDLVKLYKRVYKTLNLDPGKKEVNNSMRQIFTGLISIVNGLAGLRNNASDAHGARYKPSSHHAKLSVNSAKTISDFLVESYLHQKKLGLLKNGS